MILAKAHWLSWYERLTPRNSLRDIVFLPVKEYTGQSPEAGMWREMARWLNKDVTLSKASRVTVQIL